MAIAIQSQSKQSSRIYPVIKLSYWLLAPFQRLWWHVHAYSVIFGIMILSVMSIIVLYGYEQIRALRYSLQKRFPVASVRSLELPISMKQRS